jgi:hypothetical protein
VSILSGPGKIIQKFRDAMHVSLLFGTMGARVHGYVFAHVHACMCMRTHAFMRVCAHINKSFLDPMRSTDWEEGAYACM